MNTKWFLAAVTTLGFAGEAGAQGLVLVPDHIAIGDPVIDGLHAPGTIANPATTYISVNLPQGVPGYPQPNAGYLRLSDILAAANGSAGASPAPGTYVTPSQLFQQYDDLKRQIRRSYEGNAIGLALAGASTSLSPGKNYGLSMNFGTINGSTAVGAAGVVRVNEVLTVNGGIGVSGHTIGGRGGMNFEW